MNYSLVLLAGFFKTNKFKKLIFEKLAITIFNDNILFLQNTKYIFAFEKSNYETINYFFMKTLFL